MEIVKWRLECGTTKPYFFVGMPGASSGFHYTKPLALQYNVGRGGAFVESKPFDRRVVGSNPALAATYII